MNGAAGVVLRISSTPKSKSTIRIGIIQNFLFFQSMSHNSRPRVTCLALPASRNDLDFSELIQVAKDSLKLAEVPRGINVWFHRLPIAFRSRIISPMERVPPDEAEDEGERCKDEVI